MQLASRGNGGEEQYRAHLERRLVSGLIACPNELSDALHYICWEDFVDHKEIQEKILEEILWHKRGIFMAMANCLIQVGERLFLQRAMDPRYGAFRRRSSCGGSLLASVPVSLLVWL